MGGSLGDLVKNVVSLGAYGQKKAQDEAAAAQRRADMEARRIAASQKPMEEEATLEIGGANANPLDTLGLTATPDMEKKKKPVGLGTSGTTGLGTSVTGPLGFGG
jgi:hypothetical protein